MSNNTKLYYKTCREQAGLTQEQAIALLGISEVSTLSKYENGHLPVSPELASEMVKVYRTPLLASWYVRYTNPGLSQYLPELSALLTDGDMALQMEFADDDITDVRMAIVVNDINMSCIGGHQRLTVMRDMGKKEIDCVMVHIENPEREKILCIALNKIKGEWDNDKLDKLLHDDEIRQFELGFDKIITTIDDEFFDSESEFDDNDFENNAEADDDCSDCEDESDNIKTIIKIGSYRFDITTTEYNKMLCDIRDRGIFEKSKIIDELRRKLCND